MADSAGGCDAMIAEVVMPVALDTVYSYLVPEGLLVEPGSTVMVPFGPRETHGLVWSIAQGRGENLKAIRSVAALPVLNARLRSFLQRVSNYTLAPLGMVAKMAMRDPEVDTPEATRIGVRRVAEAVGKDGAHRITPARQRVLDAASGGLLHRKRDLAEAAACSTGVVDALVDMGLLEALAFPSDRIMQRLDAQANAPVLSSAQNVVAQSLSAHVRDRVFAPCLLEGVTGSGKTEVYFEAVAECIRMGRQALILLPEISLTPEFLARFEQRFGAAPGLWHSGVSPARRNRLWHGVAEGAAEVVVGARSSLFLPFRDLGLIIVDEEHEAAYKQDDIVRYHARDMAVLRAKIEDCPVLLASATPSLESRVNAAQGRYRHYKLEERAVGRAMPKLGALDLKQYPPEKGQFLSPALIKDMEATLARGEQVLVFLNRRGFAPLTLCKQCGHRWQCPHCDAWLVEHRFRRALICHHCGHTERRPTACIECKAEDSLMACGPGVERIAAEIAEAFPDHRRIVLSSDFPGGTERLKQELQTVANGDFSIVIGTQLIAKGHNFPHLTLAVIVDADLGLVSNDPRAAERSFQLLTQVTGRSGRGEKPGRGVLQTWQPEHPVLKALVKGDQEGFYRAEVAQREAAGLPPFGRLAILLISARDKGAAERHARMLAEAGHKLISRNDEGVLLLGPAEAPIALLRGRHRIRIILKSPRSADLQGFIRKIRSEIGPLKGGARLDVDIDPINFY